MDIDISDILAEVSRPTAPSQTFTQSPYGSHEYTYDPATAATDHMLLTRHWTSERCVPSILPYPTSLIERVMDRIRQQITRIEDLTSGTYDGTSNQGVQPSQQNLNLVLSILQTDLSRTQFLVRSYLRCRLAKITKYATYYLKYHVQNPQDSKTAHLSQQERVFLQHHQNLLTNLYNSSFLLSLPQKLRGLDDAVGGSARMDEGPDAGEGVMVRCLAREWSNEAEVEEADREMGGTQRTGEDEHATVELRCERGGVLVARWRDVKTGVERGDLEVL